MPAVSHVHSFDPSGSSSERFDRPHPDRARFTVDGGPDLERHLGEMCSRVLDGIQDSIPNRSLEAVLLGGGYGRGEGGVLRTPDGDQPYNDLEFYVFIQGNRWINRKRFGPGLHTLGDFLSRDAGVEVEFHILSLADLRASPPSMFYYDLVAGHRWLLGEESLLAGCEQHRSPEALPISEATRLLMNRCSGLLFAAEKLAHPVFTSEDSDFVGRNLAKMQLALGDAVLTASGSFHWSCRERHLRLRSLPPAPPWLLKIQRHHAEGVDFKLHPRRTLPQARDALLEVHRELVELSRLVWLWVENQRLKSAFSTPQEYASSRLNKMPDTNPWQNVLRNLSAFGFRGLLRPGRFRHPRERALQELATLLWNKPPGRLEEEGLSSPTINPNKIADYRKLWARVQ